MRNDELMIRMDLGRRWNGIWFGWFILFAFIGLKVTAEVPASALNRFAEVTMLYLENGDAEEAKNAYAQLHEEYPQYAEPIFNLGALAEDTGDTPAAEKWYRAFLEIAPDHERAAEAVGRLSALADRVTPRKLFDLGIARAWSRLKQGDAAGAYAEAAAAAEVDRSRFEAPATAARALIADRAWAEALPLLEQAEALAPADVKPELIRLRGDIANRIKREREWAEAEDRETKQEWVEAANLYAGLADEDTSGRAALLAGMNFAIAERWTEAESWLETASHLGDRELRKDVRTRLRAIRAQLVKGTESPGALPGQMAYTEGVQLLAKGQANEALVALSDAIDQTPVNPEFGKYFLMRGVARLEAGDAESAIEDLDRALLIDPSEERVHRLRALANTALGRREEAINDYRLAILAATETERGDVLPMQLRVAELYTKLGLHRTAIDEAKKLSTLTGGSELSNRALRVRKNSARALADEKEEMAALAMLLRHDALRSDETRRLNYLRRSWVVTMTKMGGGQSWAWSDTELKAKAQSVWLDKQDVTDLAFWAHDNTWLLVTRNPRVYEEQSIEHSSSFPREWVQLKWDQKYDITNVTYAQGEWHVMAARGAGLGGQRWASVSSFSDFREKISTGWDDGYRVQDLSYGDGLWVVIFCTKGAEAGQRWRYATEFPADWIREGYDSGYLISQVVFGAGKWVVVMDKSGLAQRYIRESEFPNEKIQEYWNEGYRVSDIVHIEEPLP